MLICFSARFINNNLVDSGATTDYVCHQLTLCVTSDTTIYRTLMAKVCILVMSSLVTRFHEYLNIAISLLKKVVIGIATVQGETG